MNNKISFIYFDIGGVVIKDFSGTNKWIELMDEMGVSEENRNKFDDLFKKFAIETKLGRKMEDFMTILKNELRITVPKKYSFLMAFINRFNKNDEIEECLIEAKNKYSFGLLSNMYEGMLNAIIEKGLLPKIKWKVTVDSSVVGYQKPEPEIYKLAEKLAGVRPGEILFVDNKKKNLEIPGEMGWQTYFFNSGDYEKSNEELKSLLK